MPDTAASQFRRLLTLIPMLADGEEHPIVDIATVVGLEPQQLIDDLRALVERYEVPGGFIEGVQIYQDGENVSVYSHHFLRPMRLTAAESSALELGLAMIRAEGGADAASSAENALGRLRAASVPDVVSEVMLMESEPPVFERPAFGAPMYVAASLTASGPPPDHLAVLREAIRKRRKVRLLYGGSAPAPTERTICPYSLVFVSGHWYVVAHCDRAAALRVFRVDRIASATPDRTSYEIPAGYDLDDVMGESKAFISRPDEVLRVRYSPRIAPWIAEREGVKLEGDGSVTVDHPLSDDRWAVRHVLQYAAEAEVIEPARVRSLVAATLAGM